MLLTVLAFRNGQLFLKARGEKLLLGQKRTSILCTHRKTLHRAEGALSEPELGPLFEGDFLLYYSKI